VREDPVAQICMTTTLAHTYEKHIVSTIRMRCVSHADLHSTLE